MLDTVYFHPEPSSAGPRPAPPHFSCHTGSPFLVLAVRKEPTMRKTLAWVLGAALAANGLFMLGDPAGWYAAIPGVTMTGPLNPHLVRDVGCAYLDGGRCAGGVRRRCAGAARGAGGSCVPRAARFRPPVGFSERARIRFTISSAICPPSFCRPRSPCGSHGPAVNLQKEKHHAEMADSTAHRRV